MLKRIVLAGVAGGIALMAWAFIGNGMLGFQARTQMRWLAEERAVYDVLKAAVTEPGAYVVNPALDANHEFPAGEPVFGIRYAGFGHEAAGLATLTGLALTFATALLAAWLLGLASARVQERYRRRVGFIALVGVLLVVADCLPGFGIGGFPAATALAIAAFQLGAWLLAAVVMAWAFGNPGVPAAAIPAAAPEAVAAH